VWGHTGVGPHRNLDACNYCTSDRIAVHVDHGSRFVEDHFVKVDAVLDGADACADSVLDALGCLGVSHDESVRCGCLGDEHLEFVGHEVPMLRIVARRDNTARCTHLDHVGARSDQLADLLAHLPRTFDDVRGTARVLVHHSWHVCATHFPAIAVAAGLGENRDRKLRARPGDEAVLLSFLDTEVGTAGLAHARDAACQRALGCLEVVHRERRTEVRVRTEITVSHKVNMAVEQAGSDEMAGAVNRLVAVKAGADVNDSSVFNCDVTARRCGTGAVEDRAVGLDGACRCHNHRAAQRIAGQQRFSGGPARPFLLRRQASRGRRQRTATAPMRYADSCPLRSVRPGVHRGPG
jgi:hypothetical protein